MGVCLSKKERTKRNNQYAPSRSPNVINVHDKKDSKVTIETNAKVKEVNEQLINNKDNKFELSMNTQSLNNNIQQNTSQDNNNGVNGNVENETVSKKDIEIKITEEQNKKDESVINIKDEHKSNEHLIKENNNEEKMIEDSKKREFDYILVYQLDRFARNRYDSATYKAKLKKKEPFLIY